MKRLLLLLFLTVLPCLGWALEAPDLARAAAEYQARIHNALGGQVGADVVPALGRAERYARQRLWREAIGEYERVLAATPRDAQAWLALSRAWGQARRLDGASQRTLEAAFNAYRHATTEDLRGEALLHLGDAYLSVDQPREALAAFKEGLGLREHPEYARRYQQLLEKFAFQVEGVDVSSDSATPAVCLVFSAKLRDDRAIDYRDYLQVEPAIEMVATPRDQRLCVEGVRHGEDYRITVRPGLPGADDKRLAAGESFTASVDDRKPSVGFRGSTYILPRSGGQGLPLTTVNVATVDLKLLRINDRNLIQEINDQRISATLDGYDIQSIAERSGELLWEGSMTVAEEPNEEVTSAIPMDEALASTEAGIYIVTAEDAATEIDRDYLAAVRQRIPVEQHRVLDRRP